MIVVLFGKKGEGKTYHIVNHYIKKSVLPCIVFDTMNEELYKTNCKTDHVSYMRIKSEPFPKYFKTRVLVQDDRYFRFICKELSYKQDTPLNVIVSEVDQWTNPHYIPEEFKNLLRYGRHFNINIICDVRTPSELHKYISKLANKFIIFKVTGLADLNYFKQYDEELVEKIKQLPSRDSESPYYNPVYEPIIYKL